MYKLVYILFLLPYFLISQNIKDSCLSIPLVGVHFSVQMPFGDLKQRFGNNLNTGGSFLFKTKKNFLIGIDGHYFFSKNVKEDVVAPLRNSDGFIVDNEGFPADLRLNERGLIINLIGGKVFSKLGHNPNSGLMACMGIGYMQHKIKLYDANQRVAGVKGDLKKGYDRLSGGVVCSQFLGYLFLSETRLINFYAGIECFQGFTKSYRKYNYDKGTIDTKQRVDVLLGARFGWILPLYKKMPKDFYYY